MVTQKDKEQSVVEHDKMVLSKESSVSVSTVSGNNEKGLINYEYSGNYSLSDHQRKLSNSPQSLKSELRLFMKDFTLTDDIVHKNREWL